jgi:signal peptidase I
MPPPARARLDDDDEPEDEEPTEEDEEEEAPPPRRRRKPPARRGRPRPRPSPMRRWRSPGNEESEGTEGPASEDSTPGRKPIYWRARDSLFFEPLVALAIVVLLLVSLFAYTQNWPPIYVVESNSMQHGTNDQIGLINTGDLVLAQKISVSDITPYVTGLQSGYKTYGEYGDVLLYWPNGQTTTPIIHRAILYLQYQPNGTYDAADLQGLPCGNATNAVYAYFPTGPGSLPSCRTTSLGGILDLYDIGWDSLNISLNLQNAALGRHSGFLTLGDGNSLPDQYGVTVPELSALVEPGWIIGVARGMIPWFGSVKLLLQGQAGEVPPQSWQFMGLTIIGAILIAFGIHYALRTEGIETPLRREEEEADRAQAGPGADEPAFRRFLAMLRRDHSEDEPDEDEDDDLPAHRRRKQPPTPPTKSHRGRPVPRVRRNHKPAKETDADEEL